MPVMRTFTWKDEWKNSRATWTTEEERLRITAREWRSEGWLTYNSDKYDVDAVFPPAKNDDYRNCDYFVYKGVCYGVGTEVRLKENQYFKKFRIKDYRFKRPNSWSKYIERYDYSQIDPIARFCRGMMNGVMVFQHVKQPDPSVGYKYEELGDYETSAYIPEDYIEEITKPVIVSRKIGTPSVIGNYHSLLPWKQAKIQAELWPQVLLAGLFLLLCVFTKAKEFWIALVCCIIYFVAWFSYRANNM